MKAGKQVLIASLFSWVLSCTGSRKRNLAQNHPAAMDKHTCRPAYHIEGFNSEPLDRDGQVSEVDQHATDGQTSEKDRVVTHHY